MSPIKKRGQTWMTEETGRLILSILVIVLLLLFSSYIIKIFRTNTQIEQANATLTGISDAAKKLSVGQTDTYLIESPKGWTLATFPGNSRKLCLCNTPNINDFIKDCDKKYLTCLEFSSLIEISSLGSKIILESVPKAINLRRKDSGLTILEIGIK